MNLSSPFAKKILYVAAIGVLLVPLSLISRPTTRTRDNAVRDPGGLLSQLRYQHDLAQAKLSDIDPTSETAKLSTLGLRGLAVAILWMQAIEAKDTENYEALSSTVHALTKIQPNFVKVWEYQAHNLTYNVAVEFDDYENRYEWVKRGIQFLTEGIPLNRRDHRIIDSLGAFCGHKISNSDEKVQYRRLFRRDEPFHAEMGKFVNIDNLQTPYGPDNWLLAYEWYDLSETMVRQGVPQRRKDILFYQMKPAQLRNMGLSMQDEFRPDEFSQTNWQRAHQLWIEYGDRLLRNELGTLFRMDATDRELEEIESLRQELDQLAPGAREKILTETAPQLRLTPADQQLLDTPVDQLDDQSLMQRRALEIRLGQASRRLNFDVSQQAPAADRRRAEELASEINQRLTVLARGDRDRDVVQYGNWKDQTLVESTDEALRARQMEYDASELKRRSIFDQYELVDPLTGERRIEPGALETYEKSFAVWAEILDQHPRLRQGPLGDDLMDAVRDYYGLRVAAGKEEFTTDMPLQAVVDFRAAHGESDELPTTEAVEEYRGDQRRPASQRPRPNIDFEFPDDAPADQN